MKPYRKLGQWGTPRSWTRTPNGSTTLEPASPQFDLRLDRERLVAVERGEVRAGGRRERARHARHLRRQFVDLRAQTQGESVT